MRAGSKISRRRVLATGLWLLAGLPVVARAVSRQGRTRAETGIRPPNHTQKPLGEWHLPGHDNRYSSRAELPGAMPRAPRPLWSCDPGLVPLTEALCLDVDGEDELLYGEWPLVCTTLSGVEKWRSDAGSVRAAGDGDGDGPRIYFVPNLLQVGLSNFKTR